ncbi:hypothetical protein [Neisseria dentiae]|uniref:hypothetical protein n=1 Tax=Neisseria dentiae TaxID=194197 RepID=UPI00359FD837
MAQPINQAMITQHGKLIDSRGVMGAVEVYNDLLNKGYNYAGWAKGVAEANGWNSSEPEIRGSITGRAAVMFMKDSSGRDFSDRELNEIRIDMARGYLAALSRNIRLEGGQTQTDTSFKQMRGFHKDVFEKHNLSINNWTLETPMKFIGAYNGGEAAQEKKWQELAKTQGDGADALIASAALYNYVQDFARGYIYVDDKGLKIDTAMAEQIQAQTFKVFEMKRVPERDRKEAEQWLENASRIKPLLFSRLEGQEQERHYGYSREQNPAEGPLPQQHAHSQEKNPFLEFAEKNVTEKDVEQFLARVEEYGKEQEMLERQQALENQRVSMSRSFFS